MIFIHATLCIPIYTASCRIPNPIGLVDNSENMLFTTSQPQYLGKHNYIVSHKIVVQVNFNIVFLTV